MCASVCIPPKTFPKKLASRKPFLFVVVSKEWKHFDILPGGCRTAYCAIHETQCVD